jgi:hypothetical protein
MAPWPASVYPVEPCPARSCGCWPGPPVTSATARWSSPAAATSSCAVSHRARRASSGTGWPPPACCPAPPTSGCATCSPAPSRVGPADTSTCAVGWPHSTPGCAPTRPSRSCPAASSSPSTTGKAMSRAWVATSACSPSILAPWRSPSAAWTADCGRPPIAPSTSPSRPRARSSPSARTRAGPPGGWPSWRTASRGSPPASPRAASPRAGSPRGRMATSALSTSRSHRRPAPPACSGRRTVGPHWSPSFLSAG